MAADPSWIAENWLRVVIAIGTLITSGGTVGMYTVYRNAKTKDLEIGNKADNDLNTHYAAELSALREQLVKSGTAAAERTAANEERHLAAMKAADDRHEAAMKAADERLAKFQAAAAEREESCEQRVAELRDEVRALSDEMLGLRRNVGQSSRSAIVLASQTPSIPVREAADRAADALERHDERMHTLPHERLPE